MKLGLLLVVVALAACGVDDAVDGPFIDSWQLDDQLTVTVFDHEGTAEASCVVIAYDRDGEDMAVVESDDLLPETAYHEVYVTGPFTITGGEVVTFDVDLPEIDNPDFWRWQVVCDPGALG